MTTPTPAAPTGLEPTQTRLPWRATIRTIVQVGIPAIFLLPTLIQYVIEELGPHLPPAATAWLVAAGVIITAVAGLIARIMAHPTVELALRRLPGAAFAAQPKPKPVDQGDAGRVTTNDVVAIVAVVAVVLVCLWAIGVFR